jgi:hypothetical protein
VGGLDWRSWGGRGLTGEAVHVGVSWPNGNGGEEGHPVGDGGGLSVGEQQGVSVVLAVSMVGTVVLALAGGQGSR